MMMWFYADIRAISVIRALLLNNTLKLRQVNGFNVVILKNNVLTNTTCVLRASWHLCAVVSSYSTEKQLFRATRPFTLRKVTGFMFRACSS